jgi:nicotinamide-nucleotide amidase
VSRTVSPRAALVTVGDELLLGRTVDTNAAWLGRELAGLGIPVVRRHTVGDEASEIHHAVSDALAVADLVLVTGGLGPTPDYLTRDAVASLLGRPLREDAEVLEHLRARFRDRGVPELPEPNRRVAQVPEGARKLTNPHGTAPGLAMEADDALVVLLPGVPREMRGIFGADLVSVLRAHFGARLRPVHTRTIRTTGIPESLLGQRIEERLGQGTGPVGLAFLPDEKGVDLRLTAFDMDRAEAERRFGQIEEALADILAPWRFEAPEGDLVEAVTAALRNGGRTLAVAESCTGGLVAKRMTDLAGASDVFLGGVVAYANEVKTGQLGVDPSVLAAHGAVSEVVARGMAEGVARRFGADAGVGITGIAGPGGGTEEKPVGTVWFAAALGDRVVARRERFPGDRRSIRERAAQAALFLLLRLLEGRAGE